MSKNLNYALNCGQYVLHDGDTPIGPLLNELAYCIDKTSGTRHRIGSPEVVNAWHKDAQQRFRDGGYPDMADDLVVVQGRFTLKDINLVLDNSSFGLALYQKILDGTADTLDIFGNVVTGKVILDA